MLDYRSAHLIDTTGYCGKSTIPIGPFIHKRDTIETASTRISQPTTGVFFQNLFPFFTGVRYRKGFKKQPTTIVQELSLWEKKGYSSNHPLFQGQSANFRRCKLCRKMETIMILYFHVSQFHTTNLFHIPILPKKVGVKYFLLKDVSWKFLWINYHWI